MIVDDHGLLMEGGRCVGYLFDFGEHGIHAPTGRTEVTPEQMQRHNELLSQGEILGLEQNCEVGMYGTFFHRRNADGTHTVHTWIGTRVDDWCRVSGMSITFRRKGRVFRGRLSKHADAFNFRRIS